jgi:hypothetical protein
VNTGALILNNLSWPATAGHPGDIASPFENSLDAQLDGPLWRAMTKRLDLQLLTDPKDVR